MACEAFAADIDAKLARAAVDHRNIPRYLPAYVALGALQSVWMDRYGLWKHVPDNERNGVERYCA